jgi:hypothetical protein
MTDTASIGGFLELLEKGTVVDSSETKVGCCPLMVLAFAVGEITVTG